MTLLRETNSVGIESTGNSTTTPLLTGTTFTGVAEQNYFDQVGVQLKTDVEGTLYFDFSTDGTNWDSTFPVNGFYINAGVSEFHTAIKMGRYFRIRLVNNGADQTYLRLKTYYSNNFTPSAAPVNQTLGIDADAQSVRPTDYVNEVVIGRRAGVSHFNKFGYREGLTASSGEQTIWATTGNFTPLVTASTFTITYTPASDGSTSNGAKTLYFAYVDSSGLSAIAVHTLGSSGSDVTSFSGLGINRCAISSAGTTQTNGANITITETTGGTTQAFIPSGDGTTQQCIFHVDANSDGVAKYLYFNINKISGGGGDPKVTVKAYVFNRQFQIKFEVFRSTIDTSVENTVFIDEPIGFKLSPTDVLYLVADTDTNNTVVTARFSLLEYKRN